MCIHTHTHTHTQTHMHTHTKWKPKAILIRYARPNHKIPYQCLTYVSQMESSVPGIENSKAHIKISWKHLDKRIYFLSTNGYATSSIHFCPLFYCIWILFKNYFFNYKKNFLHKNLSPCYDLRLKLVKNNQKTNNTKEIFQFVLSLLFIFIYIWAKGN